MIVTCRKCNAQFNLDKGLVKETGSKVRCSKCKHVFVIFPDESPEQVMSQSNAGADSLPTHQESRAQESTAVEDDLTREAPGGDESDPGQTVDDLDLSQIEKMLDVGGLDEEKSAFDTDRPDIENAADSQIAEAGLAEIDLSEIEKILDVDQSSADTDDMLEDEPSELIFNLEESAESDGKTTDEFDLADIEKMLEEHGGQLGRGETGVSGVEPEASAVVDPPTDAAEELDLSDLESLLSTTSGDAKIDVTEDDFAESETDAGLDFSSLEKMIEIDETTEETAESIDEPGDLELELDLDGDMFEAESAESDGDIDFSDLEQMMETEASLEDAADEPAGETTASVDEMGELELDLGEDTDEPALAGADVDELDFSNLEQMMEADASVEDAADEMGELELELGDDPPETELSESDGDLDFSSFEQMMEADASAEDAADEPARETAESVDEIGELELALESGDDPSETEPAESDGDIDFSGLEEMIENEAPLDESAESGDEDGDLALSGLEKLIEAEAPAPGEKGVGEDEFDLQFEETDDSADASVGMTEDGAGEAEDLDLEFDAEQLDAELGATEILSDGPDTEEEVKTEVVEETAVTGSEKPDKPTAKKRRSKKPLVLVLILVVLAGVAVGGYMFLKKSGMKLPFLESISKPKIQDLGNLKITTIDIDSRFFENKEAGKLFVISGIAQNGYKDSRSLIRITGKLYSKGTKGKKLVKTETVYCANALTDLELSKNSLEQIKMHLRKRAGDNNANMNIKPGEKRPFMIVFSNLPGNLDEFTVEVAGSESATASTEK